MDVLLGLRNPDLTHFVFLLEVYNQLVLSLDDVSIFLDGFASIFKPLFKVFNFLRLYLVQHLQLLIKCYQLVFLDQV